MKRLQQYLPPKAKILDLEGRALASSIFFTSFVI